MGSIGGFVFYTWENDAVKGLIMEKIDTIEKRKIGGVDQYFSIKSCNIQNPIVLYLHGGPADACIPLMTRYNGSLKKNFTVVTLEQRGAGLSYYGFSKDENLSIQTFVDDIHEFTLYLLNRFGKEKLYLVGHSWGSVLGIKFIQAYPDLVEKYVGCGQVINMKKIVEYQSSFIKQNCTKKSVLNKLNSIDISLTSDSWLNDLLFITKQVVKMGGSLYEKNNQNSLVLPFLTSKEYTIKNLINRQKGSLQGIEYFWQELMTVNFENITSFDVPIVFIEGKHDFHVCSEIAFEYYEKITSPKELYWFESSGHFPQWEQPEQFADIMKKITERKLNFHSVIFA